MRFFRLAAGFGLILVSTLASVAGAGRDGAPRLLERPVVSGKFNVLKTVRVSRGRWSGAESFSYHWQRCTAYSQGVNEDGPIAWWRMDERHGRVIHDITGYGHDGTFPPGVELGRRSPLVRYGNGEAGAAAWFRGTGPAVIPETYSFGLALDFTLEAWVNPDEVQSTVPVIVRPVAGSPGVFEIGLFVDERGRLVFQLRLREAVFDDEGTEYPEQPVRTRRLRAPARVPAGNWSHLVATFSTESGPTENDDRGEMRLYLNGRLVGSRPAAGILEEANRPILLGGFQGGRGSLSGGMDEAALYIRALSGERVRKHYLNATKGCIDVGGEDGSSFELADADQGNRLRVRVTATNASGATTVNTRVTPSVGPEREERISEGDPFAPYPPRPTPDPPRP